MRLIASIAAGTFRARSVLLRGVSTLPIPESSLFLLITELTGGVFLLNILFLPIFPTMREGGKLMIATGSKFWHGWLVTRLWQAPLGIGQHPA